MFSSLTTPRIALPILALCSTFSAGSLLAADIVQAASLGAGNNWNNPSYWGGNTPTSGNNYITAPIGTAATDFSFNGKSWTYNGSVRDAVASSTFGGTSLIIEANTRLLGKANSSGTAVSTANIVLHGGFIASAADAQGGSTLAGSIQMNAPLGALALRPNGTGAFVWNINSTITGSGTLQVATYDVSNARSGTIYLNGDLSAFSGTFYVGVGTTTNASAGNSIFAINSSAPLATLQLVPDSSAFFFYELTSNVTFAGLTIGNTVLAPGTYNGAALEAYAPGKFLDSGGSITVAAVPEPSTTALMLVTGLAAAIVVHRRNKSLRGAKACA
jgi:hypothetical protein